VFQPHTTNRTYALFDEFAASFGEADHALILPIYQPAGREVFARDVTSKALVEAIHAHGHPDARLVETFEEAMRAVVSGARQNDVVITMGAGDVTLLSDRLLEALSA
jgi:UDP-N-acetylmuramate--alanine ligase